MHNLNNQKLIFKGYRKGKSAKIPQNNILYTYDEVKDLDNYGATCNDNIYDISIDDLDLFDKFLDICDDLDLDVYALYSPHGGHTYWHCNENFTNGKDIICACGFKVDIHNKGTYIPLKCDGKLRTEVYNSDLAQITELPKLFYPISSNNSLWQLKEGDGRNDIISKHCFALHNSLHISKDEIKEIIYIINKYILKDKLADNELETILRDETFDKMHSFFVKNKFMHNIFGDYLIDKYHIVSLNEKLHVYNNEIYEHNDKTLFGYMVKEIPTLKDSQRTEVLKYLNIKSPERDAADERYIAFKNGIYDIYTDELLPFSTDRYVTIQIPWNYNPDAYDETVDMVLNNISCQDKDVRSLLEECVGYCFYRTNELGSSFFLLGDKSNGKSTFLKMIKCMLGKNNYSALDLSELSERFNTATMYNKLANIGDEYMSGSKVAIFKKLVTGETIKAEEKNQPVFMFDPFIKMFFAANEMPRIKDKTGAVLRRIILVPFNAVFDKNNPTFKHNIIKDLTTQNAMEYLIAISMLGLHRILDQQNFTQPECVIKKLEEYERNNDTVIQFIEEVGIDEIKGQNCDDVYVRYQTFCAKNGYQYSGAKNTFSLALKKKYHIETSQVRLNGKRFRIFK